MEDFLNENNYIRYGINIIPSNSLKNKFDGTILKINRPGSFDKTYESEKYADSLYCDYEIKK